jgi:hypothetical protein
VAGSSYVELILLIGLAGAVVVGLRWLVRRVRRSTWNG